ncbi:alpha/beta hydrolase fold precursor [alpha proteobacterium U9-1i]|nr:alpha/beta hydrolase fold precursor [alpha proteobacterium U9-1i]
MGVWEQTIAGLHSGVATFAYSRPGYGASTPTDDAERTSEEAAALLKATLRAAGVHPPYIMVGHSLGGLYIAKFADIYSSDVLGMVFVDARPPRFRALCEQRGVARCAGGLPQPERPPAAAAEGAGVRASEDSAPFPRRIASIPATIIASTTEWTGEGGATAHALWMEAQIAFYQRFEDARFVRAEGAGHYVQRDRPDLVATEIDRLIARL